MESGSGNPGCLLIRIFHSNDKVDDFVLTGQIFFSSQMTENEKLRFLFLFLVMGYGKILSMIIRKDERERNRDHILTFSVG